MLHLNIFQKTFLHWFSHNTGIKADQRRPIVIFWGIFLETSLKTAQNLKNMLRFVFWMCLLSSELSATLLRTKSCHVDPIALRKSCSICKQLTEFTISYPLRVLAACSMLANHRCCSTINQPIRSRREKSQMGPSSRQMIISMQLI